MEKGLYEKILKELVDKCDGVSDKSWQDIVDSYALDIHKDSLRKAFNVTDFSGYNVYKYLTENTDATNEDVELLKSIKEDIIKERKKTPSYKS